MELYSIIYYLLLLFMALVGLSLIVAIHEFGHLIFAKLFGVYVPSFSIGFGPKLLSKKIGDTEYCISAIPLGGYVEIAGNAEVGQGEQQYANLSAKDNRSFAAKSYWQKMLIMSGGILFNLISAFLMLAALYFAGAPCIGQMCSADQPIVKAVEANSNAEIAGLKSGDILTKINNSNIKTIQDFKKSVESLIDQKTKVSVMRDGKSEDLDILIGSQTIAGKKLPKIGVEWQSKPRSFVQSIHDGFNTTLEVIKDICVSLKNIFTGNLKKSGQIGGPILLLYQIAHAFGQGYKIFLFLLAIISINLAVFNVLPLPIFDGGQALFYTIEAITGRPLSEETREKIHQFTWLLVIGLFIFLSFSDIKNLFKK